MTQKVGAVVKAVLRDKDDTAIVLVLKDGNTTSLKDGDNVYVELTDVMNGNKVDFYPAAAPVEPEDDDFESIEELKPVEEVKVEVEEVKIPEPPADVVAEEPKKPEPSDADLFPDTAPAPTPEG